MTANDSNSYPPHLDKLVGQYNNTYHHSINKQNLLMLIILHWPVRITKYNNIFSKDYTE